jgi:uncharacterized membrane protein YjjP (DUF1212 family)
MSTFLHKYDRCLASIFAGVCSLVIWILVGELRWIDLPWHYQMSASDHQQVFGTMYWLDVSAKILGVIAVAWAVAAVRKSRTLFPKIVLVGSVLVFLISFVP